MVPLGESSLRETTLRLPGARRGKVRDVYELPGSRLAIIATDRVSAFDVVMPTPIPGKGRLLTAISAFWLRMVDRSGICRTHLVSTDAGAIPSSAFTPGGTTRAELEGRTTIARAARVVPIECVARGYLEGSGWKEYQERGSVCGIPLPRGLARCARLPEAIFTPATKEEGGRHDENISFDRACAVAGRGRGDHTFRNAFRDAWMGQDRKASQHPRAESTYAEGWAAGLAATTARRQQPADSSASGGILASAGPSLGRGA